MFAFDNKVDRYKTWLECPIEPLNGLAFYLFIDSPFASSNIKHCVITFITLILNMVC